MTDVDTGSSYQPSATAEGTLSLRSPAFEHGEEIPERYTCEGLDVSPPLELSGEPPEGTRSLALIVDDPDAPDPSAPRQRFVHWVLYNLLPQTRSLPEAVSSGELTAGTREGKNDWGRLGYGGPCPPIGRHRYFFTLYALDMELPGREPLTRDALLERLEGHVLSRTELVGTYQKTHPQH